MEYSSARFCALCLLPFLAFQCVMAQQQNPPQCVMEMMQKPKFMECFQGFMAFMTNAAKAGGGRPADGGEATMKLMCTPEGRVAMQCVLKYVQDCPEISQQTGGMDLGQFMKDGGMDATCGMLEGPCKAVQECIQPDAMSGHAAAKGKSNNPFAAFYQQSVQACGPMKSQFDCMIKHLKDCEAQVQQMEEAMKNAMEASVEPESALGSFKQFKDFMQNTCGIIPKSYAQGTCMMTSLTGDMFMKCYQDASNGYVMKDDEKCSMYDMQASCLDMHVAKKCGQDNANFLKSNMNLVIKNVPASCVEKFTSAATKNTNIVATTVLMLIVAVISVL